MSRIGRAPITLPAGVSVTVQSARVYVTGPKGNLEFDINDRLTVSIDGDIVQVSRPSDTPRDRAQHGLARTLIANAVIGVSQGFKKNLEIQGVGFRCTVNAGRLELTLGFSHPVAVEPPAGITIEAPEPTKITVSGIDKQLVGQVAANIRSLRAPDSYHGKGVRYQGEYIKLKPGKAAAR
jgi:large subunit ribosomal protein L6